MKLTIALILALQVSVCVYAQDWPQPDKELVDKYEGLKAVFYKRILNAYQKVRNAAQEGLGSSPAGDRAKEIYDDVSQNPRVDSAIKIISGLASEMEPVVDRARMALLGAYGQYLRPYIGEHLDNAINNIKPMLDKVLPQEG